LPPFSVYRSCSWRPIVTVSLHSGGYFTVSSRKTSEDVSERDLRRNIFIHRRLRLQTYAIEMPRPAKAEWTGLHSVSGWSLLYSLKRSCGCDIAPRVVCRCLSRQKSSWGLTNVANVVKAGIYRAVSIRSRVTNKQKR